MYVASGKARQAHTIKPTRGNAIPSQVLCLGYTSHLCTQSLQSGGCSQNGAASIAVEAVALSQWRWTSEGKERESETVGLGPDTLWNTLANGLRKSSLTWVFTFDAYRIVVALGLFDKIDSGDLCLYGNDPGDCDENGNMAKDTWRGLLVCDRPPTIIIARHRDSGGSFKILDVMNYGVKSWNQMLGLGEQQGIPCLQCEQSSESKVSLAVARMHALRRFVTAYKDFLTTNGLGSWQNTLGSQAYHSYRRKYYDASIHVHTRNDVLAMEREAYYTGRCEAYRLGVVEGPLYHLDVNSMYSSLIARAKVPCGLSRWKESPPSNVVNLVCRLEPVIARVDIDTDTPLYPTRNGNEILWPVGKFTSSLCGPELAIAFANNHVRRVHFAAVYESDVLFSSWVADLWRLRQEYEASGNRTFIALCKGLLTALPGKFGQHLRRWRDVPQYVNDLRWEQWFRRHPKSGKLTKWRCIAGHTQVYEECGEHPESVPSLAGWITSLGRVHLLGLMQIAGRENIYYVDTDSLFTNFDGFWRLHNAGQIGRNELGKLKVVGVHDSVEFRGTQYYVADGKVTCAGLPPGTPITVDGQWSEWSMSGLDHALSHKERPKPNVRLVRQSYREQYKRGKRQSDGKVIPYRIQTW